MPPADERIVWHGAPKEVGESAGQLVTVQKVWVLGCWFFIKLNSEEEVGESAVARSELHASSWAVPFVTGEVNNLGKVIEFLNGYRASPCFGGECFDDLAGAVLVVDIVEFTRQILIELEVWSFVAQRSLNFNEVDDGAAWADGDPE